MSSAVAVDNPLRRRNRAVAIALVALAIGIVAERVRTYAEPLDRDTAGYAVLAHEMLRGRHLYSDLWERKPPLLFGTFAVGELVAGYGQGEVFLVNVAMALAILAGCFAVGSRVSGTVRGGVAAAALWLIVGADPWIQGNQPNGEIFVNAALTLAVAGLVAPPGRWWRTGLWAGAGFTAASMYEQHSVITCATLAAGYALAGGRAERATRLKAMGVAALVGAVGWGATAGYFGAVGRLRPATDVLFNQLFTGANLSTNLRNACRPQHLFPDFMAWAGLIMLLVPIARLAGRAPAPAHARVDHPIWVWVGWAVGTWVTIALPGRFFPHYYQLWLPPVCVAGGWAVSRLVGIGTGLPAVARAAAVVVVGALLLLRQMPPFAWSPDEWAVRKFHENFPEQAQLGRRLDRLLRPDETFWVFGSDNTVYFMSQRPPVCGMMFIEPMIDDPRPTRWSRLIADLDRSRPPLILVRLACIGWLYEGSPLRAWIEANYAFVPANLGCPSYGFWVRRDDDALRQRLLAPPAP